MNTEYKFSKDAIAARISELNEELKQSGAGGDLLTVGLDVIAQRVTNDPRSYLDYGPYWWALKKLLIAKGKAAGEFVDDFIAKEYKGETDLETLVAADMFRDLCLGMYFRYTNEFLLDPDSAKNWILNDPDYEALAFALSL